MEEEYKALLVRVQRINEAKGYRLEMNNDDETYVFSIYDGEIIVCYIQIGKSTGTIVIGKTRRKRSLEDQNIFPISWISTEDAYQRQGLALLLLIYSISYLKYEFPYIGYVTLDDDSNNSNIIGKNIYGSLGFDFRDDVQMDILRPKRIKLSGPEKQLLLDNNFISHNFISRAINVLNEKFPGIGGKLKIKKSKKTRKTKQLKQSKKFRKTKRRL